MSTHGYVEYDENSLAVRPLAELQTLRLSDASQDVRGWELHDRGGRRVGLVADLLVDIDRLRSDGLLVSVADGDRAGALVVVPLDGLAPDLAGRRLMPGAGMAPIALRYQSTTRYAVWAAVAVAIIAFAVWILGSLG
jgi:hypothetical protein